ncbi:hypothetical protein EB796_003036 [Bugula neritina]|nr:hypothetical protein EB796_003036 [Bugula neritina]
MRNGKDTAVSLYKHLMNLTRNLNSQNSVLKQVTSMTFSDFLKEHLLDKDQYYGTHFDYIEYMWSLKDDPNVLIVFYEDLITDTILSIQKINKFMGTGRSDELIEQIADAINIDKMREGKATSMDDATERMGIYRNAKKESAKHVYRKGTVGDWKNYFTVADDELFDSILAKWSGGKDIPFRYTL